MNIDLSKKDILLATLGIIVVLGSLFFIGLGIKRSLNNQEKSNSSVSNEPEPSFPKEATSTVEDNKQSSSTEQIESSSTTIKKQQEPPPEPSPEDLKEGSAVMKTPSEPAEEPAKDDIDLVSINNSSCDPSQVKKRDRSGIVLEVTAQDQAYQFQIKQTNIEEDFEKGETKTVSFPAYFVEKDTIFFRCQPLN